MVDETLDTFIEKMPKIELHLHLEGSIQPETAFHLIKNNNPYNPPKSVEEIKQRYRFGNLTEFIYGMKSVTDNILSIDDLQDVACQMLTNLAKENVVYVEYDCALQKYINLGLKLEAIVDALWQCAQKFEQEKGIMSRLIVNSQRSHGAESVESLAGKIIKLNHPYIVGFGLSGDESKYPQKFFTTAFEILQREGMHRTVHAGEAVGPRSVWDAIRLLYAERIDHGTRAIEDEELVKLLVEREIPLTQCLTSNVKLNVVNDYLSHPFGAFLKRNVRVTLNTDDPAIFESNLTNEIKIATHEFNLSINDLNTLTSNSVDASFLTKTEKKVLSEKVKRSSKELLKTMEPN